MSAEFHTRDSLGGDSSNANQKIVRVTRYRHRGQRGAVCVRRRRRWTAGDPDRRRREGKEVIVTQEVIKEQIVEVTSAAPTAAPEWTTPHPILSLPEVRKAIAHCSNRDELIASVYPFLSEEDKAKLRMDTFIPKDSAWYAKVVDPNAEIIDYTYDITGAGQLLDAAGWKLPEGATLRENENGDPLAHQVHHHQRAVPPDLGRRVRQADAGLRHPAPAVVHPRQHLVRQQLRPAPARLRVGRLRLGRRARAAQHHPVRLRPDPAAQPTTGTARTTWAGATTRPALRSRPRPTC